MYIIIIGCGELGIKLAEELSWDKHDVVVIDKKLSALRKLGSNFNGQTISADALDLEVLKTAGIERAEVLFLLTGNDNLNLVIGQLAKKMFKVRKVIVQVFSFSKERVFKNKGLIIINRNNLFLDRFKEALIS
ncbi:TrkA family potassium uptake protein [Candidatus Woesearchaeota archaeon]|nr:MAG: TrkA family potassium uptake protein [Candidatus Woesearchaeota archaeon]